MITIRTGSTFLAAISVLASSVGLLPARADDRYDDAPPYVHPVAESATIDPLLTVGARVPRLGGGIGGTFLFVGIPDGLGLLPQADQAPGFSLLVNHEFEQAAGGAAGPLPSGSRVSELKFKNDSAHPGLPSRTSAGRYTIAQVYAGEPSALVDPVTAGISRFCSAFLGTETVGFDRPIFLHGEESSSPGTFDGRGGLAFADFDGKTTTLPRIGRAPWENVVAVPSTGARTVIFALEDGPSSGNGLNSQLYMYVGTKQPQASHDVLSRNGLNNGRLYVFAGDDSLLNSEATFNQKDSNVSGHWVSVDWSLTDAELNTASVNAGAFAFVRIEDGASDPVHPGSFWFVTTGKPSSANPYGRIYHLEFNPADPLAGATVTIKVDGSEGIVSPDNIDINHQGEIAICEDPNYHLDQLGLTRDSSVWIYDIASATLARVAEIDRPSAVTHALAADSLNSDNPGSDYPGGWEVSGIIDAERVLGRGGWIFDVQAHSLRINPVAETVEGGQVLGLVYAGNHGRSSKDRSERIGLSLGEQTPVGAPSSGFARELRVAPNPSSGQMQVEFSLAQAGHVSATVFDAAGREVRALTNGQFAAGAQNLRWDGVNDSGQPVQGGVYFIRLQTGTASHNVRVLIVR